MESSDIFLKAAELMKRDVTTYMCHAITIAIDDPELGDNDIPKEIREAGFTYNNYEKFICKNYPHLEDHLMKQNDYTNAWIMMPIGNV